MMSIPLPLEISFGYCSVTYVTQAAKKTTKPSMANAPKTTSPVQVALLKEQSTDGFETRDTVPFGLLAQWNGLSDSIASVRKSTRNRSPMEFMMWSAVMFCLKNRFMAKKMAHSSRIPVGKMNSFSTYFPSACESGNMQDTASTSRLKLSTDTTFRKLLIGSTHFTSRTRNTERACTATAVCPMQMPTASVLRLILDTSTLAYKAIATRPASPTAVMNRIGTSEEPVHSSHPPVTLSIWWLGRQLAHPIPSRPLAHVPMGPPGHSSPSRHRKTE
mmetsp:Transcript_92284/g.257820  ORF Transcript_92284/g.257820 Transcript_92284/m.257820 type:complete len:274 (-) Transcript_92284:117-938(-)